MALFFLAFRLSPGPWGIIAGFIAFIACCWWAEMRWLRQASTEDKRLALEDRVRNPPS